MGWGMNASAQNAHFKEGVFKTWYVHSAGHYLNWTDKKVKTDNTLLLKYSRRSQSNETEPKISRTQLVGLLVDWFGNRT